MDKGNHIDHIAVIEIYRNMSEVEDKKSARVRDRRVHMANERTFLAWIRTSIGIMAFGFVVEKFSLFIKQVSYFLGQTNIDKLLILLMDIHQSLEYSLWASVP
jgi:uncharacterized membrane protein YidH (DUF202 family)